MAEVMHEQKLGPNGALVRCMETLHANKQWLINKLKPFKDHYLIFDFPGQVSLYCYVFWLSCYNMQFTLFSWTGQFILLCFLVVLLQYADYTVFLDRSVYGVVFFGCLVTLYSLRCIIILVFLSMVCCNYSTCIVNKLSA